MNLSSITPRGWLALILGTGAAAFLTLLLLKGEVASLFESQTEPQVVVSTGAVSAGDTMSALLASHKLDNEAVYNVQKSLQTVFNLRRMIPGHRYDVVTSTDGVFQKFVYRTDPITSYVVTRSSMGVYDVNETVKKTVWIERRVTAEVTENLYRDLLKQGNEEPFVANLVADLADNIFAWRIDFFTEQRPGDKLVVLLEEEHLVGSEKPLPGRLRILSASYTGKATRRTENIAVRFQAPGQARPDFYDEDGNAVRKAFLRAPFTHRGFRVSSGFNPRRLHPILRTYRPHHGTDYAAAHGTNVAAIGKGKVIYAGWKGGYGRCVDVRHSSKYVSRYGHLSRIAVKPGQTVHQGQYIGNVGSSGLSTGPHLHFEMLVDGRQRNFLNMDFPSASAVAKTHIDEYKQVRDELLARLHSALEPTQLVAAPADETK